MTLVVDGLQGVRELANRPVGHSDWIPVTQDMVTAFAEVGQDWNWVHVDAARAAASRFGGTIAHGFLTMALLVPLKRSLMEVRNIGMAVNYGFDRVRMPAPVPVGSRIRLEMRMGAVEDVGDGGMQSTQHCVVQCDVSDRPALVADWLVRHYPAPAAERVAA